jgi:hypothetical protein
MANFIPSGYSQVAFKWSLLGDPQPIVCTFGMSGEVTGPDLENICDDWLAVFPATTMSSSYTFMGASSTTGPSGSGEQYDAARSVIGSVGTSPPASNSALGVRKNTSRGGRKGKGRWFLPAGYLVESDIDALGNISAAVVNGLQTKINTFGNTIVSDGPMVLLHADPSESPTPVNSMTVVRKIYSTPNRMGR